MEQDTLSRPPRDDLVRALPSGFELRDATDDGPPTLTGHFAVFNEWTEIDSIFEGHFMERVAPGAFKKTFQESQPKVLFQHGMDPQIGDKPLGTPLTLEEDERGAFYEVELLDADYVRGSILPGLKANLYGSSFRFSVIREEFDRHTEKSDHNPNGLPERTLKEVRVPEFGPVTFPAYANATAGVRSLTDQYIFDRLACNQEQAREILLAAPALAPSTTPDAAPVAPLVPERRDPRFRNREEFLAWMSES